MSLIYVQQKIFEISLSHVNKLNITCCFIKRNDIVTLSNLRVKGHYIKITCVQSIQYDYTLFTDGHSAFQTTGK